MVIARVCANICSCGRPGSKPGFSWVVAFLLACDGARVSVEVPTLRGWRPSTFDVRAHVPACRSSRSGDLVVHLFRDSLDTPACIPTRVACVGSRYGGRLADALGLAREFAACISSPPRSNAYAQMASLNSAGRNACVGQALLSTLDPAPENGICCESQPFTSLSGCCPKLMA